MVKITFIINPKGGSYQDIRPMIKERFDGKYEYTVVVTEKGGDVAEFTRTAVQEGIEMIVVLGGDGTVMEAAQILGGTGIPLAILPGGTANVVAKELAIEDTVPVLLDKLANNKFNYCEYDMAKINGELWFIRINVGVLASMVTQAPYRLKAVFGQLAYMFSAVRSYLFTRYTVYNLVVDGAEYLVRGSSLVITNIANVGHNKIHFAPGVKADDGYLDIIVFRKASIYAVYIWIKALITERRMEKEIFQWRGKKILFSSTPPQEVVRDDEVITAQKYEVEIWPRALKLVVPRRD
jgi:diacylglycerol kinase (ATP)